MQTSKRDINNIIKIKDTFLKLSANKVSKIQKVINNKGRKDKPRLDMTIKSLLIKQVIISINSYNSEKMMDKANTYINRLLKGVKSKCSVDFIYANCQKYSMKYIYSTS